MDLIHPKGEKGIMPYSLLFLLSLFFFTSCENDVVITDAAPAAEAKEPSLPNQLVDVLSDAYDGMFRFTITKKSPYAPASGLFACAVILRCRLATLTSLLVRCC